MAQPVKQTIAELHPELSEKSTYSLIIDGTNLLRLSFADTGQRHPTESRFEAIPPLRDTRVPSTGIRP